MMRSALFGRDRELQVLTTMVNQALAGKGSTLVVRGETGIGKSSLLAAATAIAADHGLRVLSTTGVQAETHVPYAGLHRLIGTTLEGAIEGAHEIAPHRVGLAALHLIAADPTARASVLVVDDGQWLDVPTWAALTFLGRRLSADPILLLIGMRDGVETEHRLATASLPELAIGPLADPEAAALLDHTAPALSSAARERVLADAQGNPLGVVEFGSAAARYGPGVLLPTWLPLSTRVERIFAGLAAELPAQTRTLMLVAAFDDGDGLNEILTAGSRLEGGSVTLADVEPAVVAGLVSVDEGFRLRLRHPLLRSALRQGASNSQRSRVHAALADVLADDPDRRVWHRAAVAVGSDETLARELADIAARMRARSADAARMALERAAELSADPRLQSSRLLGALEIAEQEGSHDSVVRLIGDIEVGHLSPSEQARLAWIRETSLGEPWTGPAKTATLTAIAGHLGREGDVERAMESLLALASRFFWSNPDTRTRELLAATAESLSLPISDSRLLCVLAAAQPIERGATIIGALNELMRRVDITPKELSVLGSAATSVGAYHLATKFFAAATSGLRAQGRLGTLSWALMGQAWTAAQLGDVRLGFAVATEARGVAVEATHPIQAVTAGLALGQVEALRGNGSVARELADQSERALMAAGADAMLGMVALVRGCEALGSGRPAEAYEHLWPIFDPSADSMHPHLRFSALGHLAQAAAQCGRLAELRRAADELQPIADTSRSPILQVTLAYAGAVTAPGGEAGERFAAALAADLADWPFERARLQLAHGAWLRRRRQPADSRPLLRSACAVFDALGASAWAEHARRELRATGETLRRPIDGRDQLTPQELQVAQLAADGLSNREIAERLFLSPRTVTTHLSRIFPKLGIISRRELARVMGTPRPEDT